MQPARMAERAELGDVAAKEHRHRPVGHDTHPSGQERQLEQVADLVANQPGKPRSRIPEDLGDALGPSERRAHADHPVRVWLDVAGEVLRQPARLPEGVLARRRVRAAGRRVRDARAVPSAQTASRPATRSCSSTWTWPASSTGRPHSASSGPPRRPRSRTMRAFRSARRPRASPTRRRAVRAACACAPRHPGARAAGRRTCRGAPAARAGSGRRPRRGPVRCGTAGRRG